MYLADAFAFRIYSYVIEEVDSAQVYTGTYISNSKTPTRDWLSFVCTNVMRIIVLLFLTKRF